MAQRTILHLDMDAFFAAIEEREHPEWKGMPVVVGAEPAEGRGRGVVSTANYKAREYGIKSAMPISKAWQLAPKAIYVIPRFSLYQQVSDRIMSMVRAMFPVVEQVSIDEAYADVSGTEDPETIARALKQKILTQERLTCSIGIGPNKLVAKIASDFKKPNGLTMVKPQEVLDFLAPLSVRVIPGVGPKGEETLNQAGIRTIAELWRIPGETLTEWFGVWGSELYARARGIDERPVSEEHEVRSASREKTFERDTLNRTFLVDELMRLAERVHGDLQDAHMRCHTIGIRVRFDDFETHTRARTIEKVTEDLKIVQAHALRLFLPFLEKKENPHRKLIRLLGVRLSSLEPYEGG